ncbi:hypothetical protein Pint_17981 [Pistacia integerrima]|uniref:Uncharacterized protein n=1 Tax=Pistacia integerrima TaxID=434235 RepID=A0ACC0Z2N4_9ROSI|nr:hypothetical protein Pint_17981 [Pistacia integerrima]
MLFNILVIVIGKLPCMLFDI